METTFVVSVCCKGMIQNIFRFLWILVVTFCTSVLWTQCEADHNVIVTNFEFTPSSLTVVPGKVDFTVGRRAAGLWTVEYTGGNQAWVPGSD